MTGKRALFLLLLGAAALGAGALQAGFPPDEVEAEQVGAPVTLDRDLRAVRILCGLEDTEPQEWDGRVTVTGGTLVRLRGVNSEAGDWVASDSFHLVSRPDPDPDEQWRGRTGGGIPDEEENEGRPGFDPPAVSVEKGVLAEIRGGDETLVQVETRQGAFAFTLQDAQPGRRRRRMMAGGAAVEGAAPHAQVTSTAGDEDFPACATAADGTVWAAFVAYQRGPDVKLDELRSGKFDSLVARGNGDQVRLMKFDGREWSPAVNVSAPGLDVWRPTTAVDGEGKIWTVWAQEAGGNWDLYARRYDPATGRLAGVRRLTSDAGADLNPVAATDTRGTVWIAWQGWREGAFDIWLASLDGGELRPERVSTSSANDWHPAIAAGPAGEIWVCWDTYEKGNYDVLARRMASGRLEPALAVAVSPRFEARPSIVVDRQGRLWIGYEDAAPNWGKDYGTRWEGPSGEQFYLERRINVRCLTSSGRLQTAEPVPFEATNTTYPPGPRVRVSFPRLGLDDQGRLWLLYRRHPVATGAGERWISLATSYSGETWSPAVQLPESTNLLDNRPAIAGVRGGLLALYSGDGRTQGVQTARENNLFSTVLAPADDPLPPGLTAVNPAGRGAAPPPVHPDEPADIERMRSYRARVGGRSYRLLRGEFHRHTEMTSHRDQDGPFEEIWRYGLDVAKMDWIGSGDHDNGGGNEYPWWLTQKQSSMYFHAPTFLPMFTYERSVVYPSGHRNVMFARRGIRPLPRITQGTGMGMGMGGGMGGQNPMLFGTPGEGSPDIKNLYAYLKRFDGICSSHTSATNMGTDWRDNDPEVEPVVEIYQGHRQSYEEPKAPMAAKDAQDSIGGYQPAGYVWNAFGKGYRLGFQISSDHISTHLSYAVVYAESPRREAILDAFKKRHSYGANDNIILDVRCGSHMMGDEFTRSAPPKIEITVEGTGPIAQVDIVRQVDRSRPQYVYATRPGKRSVKLAWTDADAQAGAVNMYYVRIMQENGALAWASPMWIHYRP